MMIFDCLKSLSTYKTPLMGLFVNDDIEIVANLI